MNASFEEKSAWIQVGAMVVVLGSYFAIALQMHTAGVSDIRAYAPVFAVSVVVLVAVITVGHIAVALTSRHHDHDERDKLIAWRSEYHSSWVVAIGVLAAISAMVIGTETVLIAHGLFLSLLLSELLSCGLKVLFYRRGV